MSWLKNIGCVAFMAACSSAAAWTAQPDKSPSLASTLAAASEAQAKGDFSSAAAFYRQAVKMSPGTAELWANLGLMDDLTGNISEAMKSFTEAAHLNGSMYVPQLFLGIENLKLNQAETAIPFLQRAEQINPKDPQASLALGRAFALSGKGDRSSDAYLRAIELVPGNGDAWLGLGIAVLQQSSADDRALARSYKDSVYTKLRAGETFAEQGKLIRASNAYTSALMAKPALPPCAHAAYGIVLMRQQEISKASSEFDLERKVNPGCGLAGIGLVAIRIAQGDRDGAFKELLTLWQADHGFVEENLALLRDVLSDNQRQQLLHMAEDLQAHQDIPSAEVADAPPIESQSAETFYRSGQYQKCSDRLRPHLHALSQSSLLLLAPCAYYSGDYRTASLAARRLKSIAATRANGLYWESRADQKSAIAALSRAGETASDSPQLHVLLGDIYRQKERWEDAEREYRKALDLEPQSQTAGLGLAMALFGAGKSDEALEVDEALLQKSSDQPEENLLAGEILVRGGRFTEAESHLRKIHDTGQKFMPRVHNLLGEIYFSTGRLPQALAEFKLSQSIDSDGSIHYQLGRVYQKLGEKEKAEDAFRVSKQLREQSDDSLVATPQ